MTGVLCSDNYFVIIAMAGRADGTFRISLTYPVRGQALQQGMVQTAGTAGGLELPRQLWESMMLGKWQSKFREVVWPDPGHPCAAFFSRGPSNRSQRKMAQILLVVFLRHAGIYCNCLLQV